jgi:Flp pilus assembly protein CpaB
VVVPGDRVDVLATFPPGATTGGPHAETVAPEAEILLIVDGPAYDESAEAATVMLLVTAETAERLAYARSMGELSLAIAGSETVPSP